MGDMWAKLLAYAAIGAAGATVWFFIFWTFFDFWRSRRTLAYTTMAVTLLGSAGIVGALWDSTFGARIDVPRGLQMFGWVLIGIASVFGWVADRQIGMRVRSFMPFFDRKGRIELRTTGAYGVVRHPIYAAGRVFQFGVFLVTGYPSVLVAWAIFGFGAIWFSRREEERLTSLLDDPTEYERYRERVPALFPRLWRTGSAR